jgi:hypothetical protein
MVGADYGWGHRMGSPYVRSVDRYNVGFSCVTNRNLKGRGKPLMTETPGDEEYTMTYRTLVCHTEGCGNAGQAIGLSVPGNVDAYACGVCGQEITDVTDRERETA